MSRSVNISTEVFAAIWANRAAGEETEDAILRRLLGCELSSKETQNLTESPSGGGVHDDRNGVNFPEGFEIFRFYKRREYVAQSHGGAWIRKDNGKRFPTLNQLNSSIAAGVENVWNGNWKFRATDGSVKSIAELRR
ncbi:hypothetical protein IY145_21190 [Methylosinus sp. H3A]|uniref:hypothetical protein n=1 Tax=Methylosinus sp. H3A TaxID=2785786 RepID=UPI0018C20081|nr:hypothetical protein [Methylosinus sp. H3A]MBG0811868.1 hypothetical protein [Methylosinus sp. H3A]